MRYIVIIIVNGDIIFGNMLSDCKDVIRLKDVVIRNYLKNERWCKRDG